MTFCDYFVARTGHDGNHRCYRLNVDPASDWPGHPGGGFY